MAGNAVEKIIRAYLASDDPLPRGATHEIGDGDFRAIGAEFLRHLVAVGGLTPDDEVLDLGCGFARIALPLARYLAPGSRYFGFDVTAEPVDWCREHLTPRHPNFVFEHIDFVHPLYNPRGIYPGPIGFAPILKGLMDWQPSFVIAVSLFTHLDANTTRQFLADVGKLLRPGGRLFMTAFLVGPGTPPPTAGSAFPQRAWRTHGPLVALRGEPLTAAVGFAPDWLLAQCASYGLITEQIHFGCWRRGAGAAPFQDLVLCSKA